MELVGELLDKEIRVSMSPQTAAQGETRAATLAVAESESKRSYSDI